MYHKNDTYLFHINFLFYPRCSLSAFQWFECHFFFSLIFVLNRYSAFTFILDQSRLWKFGELYGKTVAE
jgi:hypothetical protein